MDPGHASFLDVAFWQQLVVTLVGVGGGVPIALWLNRRLERRGASAEQQARHQRRQQVLTAIKNEVLQNKDALETVLRGTRSRKIESAPLWLSVLEATAALKCELLAVPLCEALDELLYLLVAHRSGHPRDY